MSDNIDLKLNVDVKVSEAERLEALRLEFAKINAEILELAKNAKAAFTALSSIHGKGRARASGATGSAGADRSAVDAERDLYSELRKRFAFERRMVSQRRAEESDSARAVRAEQAEVERRFRAQLAWNTRIAAQRQREEAAAEAAVRREIAETARMRDRAARQAIADAKRIEAAQARAAEKARTGLGNVRAGAGRIAAVGGVTGAILGHETKRAIDSLTRSGIGIDDALTQAQIHIYGTKSGDDARQAAASLRKRLMPVATQLGTRTADMLGAYVEAVQAGVEEDVLDKVVDLGSKYAKMNKLPLSNTLEESGYALQGLKTFGKLNDKSISDYYNHSAYLVATTAANRTQMMSFGKRGLAAGASVGMSPDETLSFGAAATAAGAEGNQAARMLSSQGGRIAGWELHAQTLSRKRKKSAEDRLFLDAPRLMGFGSYKELSQSFRQSFFDTLVRVQENLRKVADPLKRREIEKQLFGQEFGSFTDAMVMGSNLREYRNKLKNPEADTFIEHNWKKQTDSFGFIVEQIHAVVDNLTDSLGLALKPLWTDLRDWTMRAPRAFASFEAAFRSGIEGLMFGLGSADGTLAGLLKKALGDPGSFRLDARTFFDFAKGVGTGLREAAETVRKFFSAFSGADASAETIGRLTAKFLALSAACLALAPVMAVLGGLTTMIGGLVAMARAAGSFMTTGAAAGAAGAAGGGALAGVAKLLSRTFVLGLAAEIGANRGEISTLILDAVRPLWSAIKDGVRRAFSWEGAKSGGKAILNEFIPAPLQKWMDGDGKGTSGDGHWQDPPVRKPVQELRQSLDRNTDALRDGAKVQKQSVDEADFRSLIHPANFGGAATAIRDGIRSTAAGALPLSGAVGRSGLDTSGPAIGQSIPGKPIGGMTGMGRRGIMGGGLGGIGASDNSPIGAFKGSATFDSLAPRIMSDLRKDFGLDREGAAAILGNLGHESGGFRHMQEINPRGGGRGGYGWAQWTGPRRRQFEKWCQDKGLNPTSYEANYGFLRHELQTSESGAIGALKRASGLEGKTAAFEGKFERAGVKGYASRFKFARRALGLPDGVAGVSGPVAAAQAEVRKTTEIGDGIRSTGWKPKAPTVPAAAPSKGLGDLDVTPQAKAGGLGQNTPLSPSRTGAAAGGARAAGGAVTNHVTVNGSHLTPQEMTSAVQRALAQSMDRRAHDTDTYA